MATSGTFLDGRGAHGDGARHTYPGGMARSPLTLAASVTSALPRVAVVGVAPLTEGVSGRYDSAIATLDDGRRVVVRVPVNDQAEQDQRADGPCRPLRDPPRAEGHLARQTNRLEMP